MLRGFGREICKCTAKMQFICFARPFLRSRSLVEIIICVFSIVIIRFNEQRDENSDENPNSKRTIEIFHFKRSAMILYDLIKCNMITENCIIV